MYASELRTCGLGAVVAVLLGAGVGVGWNYFADSANESAVAVAATALAQQGVSNPPLACPPPREGPVDEAPRPPASSRPKNQPETTHATGALKVTHATHTSRARRPDGPDGGERMTF